MIEAWNFPGFCPRAYDLAAEALFQRLVALHMVPVVVRRQNMCQVPAALGQLPVDFRRIRRIDGGGFPALVIVQQNAIIVGAADELMNIETGHGDEETLLRRLNSLPPMDMLGRDGYR